MSLQYVSLVLDLYDGTTAPVTTGKVTLTPNVVVTDSTDHVVVTQKPVVVSLFSNPLPTVTLVACDNSSLSPSGWGWLIQPQFPGAPPGNLYLVNYASGATQYLSELLPASSAPAAYTLIPVSGTPGATGEVITITSLTPTPVAAWQAPSGGGGGGTLPLQI